MIAPGRSLVDRAAYEADQRWRAKRGMSLEISPNQARSMRRRRAAGAANPAVPHAHTRERERRALALLPATVAELESPLALSRPGVEFLLERIGAVKTGEQRMVPDVRGTLRPRPVWALPAQGGAK